MIRYVVPADRILGELHLCEWPDPPRCPWGLRLPHPTEATPEFLARAGRRYTVTRCALDRGHDGPCDPPRPGYNPPRPTTLCGQPMPDAEVWVLFDPAPDDRVCEGCSAEADRRRPPPTDEARALLDERYGAPSPLDDRRDRAARAR